MKKLLKRVKNERGLTLVELLAVVVILGIIAAIAIPSIGNIIENSKKDAAVANAQQILSAATLYKAGGGELTGTYKDELIKYIEGEKIINPWTNAEIGADIVWSVSEDEAKGNVVTIPFGECNITNKSSLELTDLGRAACE